MAGSLAQLQRALSAANVSSASCSGVAATNERKSSPRLDARYGNSTHILPSLPIAFDASTNDGVVSVTYLSSAKLTRQTKFGEWVAGITGNASVVVRMRPAQVTLLDQAAADRGVTRSEMVRALADLMMSYHQGAAARTVPSWFWAISDQLESWIEH